jgi:hypothetical protein
MWPSPTTRVTSGSVTGHVSAPVLQLRCRTATERPRHQRSLIRSVAQALQETGEPPVHECLRPLRCGVADPEIDVVGLDLPPPRKRQVRGWHLPATAVQHGLVPGRLRKVSERPVDRGVDTTKICHQLIEARSCGRLDGRGTARCTLVVLLHDPPLGRGLEPTHDAGTVEGQVRQHVSDRPARQQAGCPGSVRLQSPQGLIQPRMGLHAGGDLHPRSRHNRTLTPRGPRDRNGDRDRRVGCGRPPAAGNDGDYQPAFLVARHGLER